MKKFLGLPLFLLLCFSCKEQPTQAAPASITAYVHFETYGIAGKKITLVQTGATRVTDSTGMVVFSVPQGSYTVRAFDLDAAGAGVANSYNDFPVKVQSGEKTTVDIFDCLGCVSSAK